MQYWSTLVIWGSLDVTDDISPCRCFVLIFLPCTVACVSSQAVFIALKNHFLVVSEASHFSHWTIQTYAIFRQNITESGILSHLHTVNSSTVYNFFPFLPPRWTLCSNVSLSAQTWKKQHNVSWRWERVTCKLLSLNKLKEATMQSFICVYVFQAV